VQRSYVQMTTENDRIRVRFTKERGRISEFVVQYESQASDQWHPVIRYDTAHGSAHTDVMKPDGTTEKRLLHLPNYNDALSYAEEDVKANWERYKDLYFRR
jgi:hypothetical protein